MRKIFGKNYLTILAIFGLDFLLSSHVEAAARETMASRNHICVLERQPPHRTARVPTAQRYLGSEWKPLTSADLSPLSLENLFSEQIPDYEVSPPYREGIVCLVYVGREVTAYFGDTSGQCARAFSSNPLPCSHR